LDRGIEDIETADSSGTGLKGDIASQSQTPTEGENSDSAAEADSDEDRGSAFDSAQSGRGSDEPSVDVEASAAATSDKAAAKTSRLSGGISLRPNAGSGKPSLLSDLSGLGCSALAPARNHPALDICEILPWRFLDSVKSSAVHCSACPWDAEAAGQSVSSSKPRGDWEKREAHGRDRQNSGKNFNRHSGTTPKGNSNGRRSTWARDFGDLDREPIAPLETSSSSWAAQQKTYKEERQTGDTASGTTLTAAEITRSIRSTLNKITVEKFAPLSEQLLSCGISTQEHLEILMHEVMEKATMQHHFIEMYTTLCSSIETWSKESNIPQTADPSAKVSFKKILLNECQASFERYHKPADHLKDLQGEEKNEAETRWKLKTMGNIRFVGALLNAKMVASQVINSISGELLAEPVSPEALERLAAFLNTIGQHFDHESWQYHSQFVQTFGKVKELSISEHVPNRVRCLLADVLDLRRTHWQDERLATRKDAGPMTLDAVAQKAREDERENLSRSTPKGDRSGSMNWSQAPSRGNSSRGGGSWEQQGPRRSVGGNPKLRASASPDGQQSSQPASQQGSQQGSRQGSRQGSPHSSTGRFQAAFQDRSKEAKAPPSPNRSKRPLNLDKLRKEIFAATKELSISRDMAEATQRVKELQVPVEHQAAELSHILQQACEESKAEVRAVCFQFAVQLLVLKVFAKSEALEGLTKLFTESYKELVLDMPSLPSIIRDELLPILGDLVKADLLAEDALEDLASGL